jgi:signal transduction histidine kinase
LVSEVQRLVRRRYWIQVFWMAIAAIELVYCLISAGMVTRGLYASWRGAALIALAAVYMGRMVWAMFAAHWHSPRASASAPPLAATARIWGITAALTVGLIALHPMMGWMAYTLFGMAFTLFELPWALIPGLLSYLLIPFTIVLNGFATVADVTQPGALVGWVGAFGVYTAFIYWPTKTMRDRIRREIGIAELERVHGELQEAHRQLEASAERDRELAVLRERGRLAREMHDTLGHALVLTAVKLEAARRLRGVDAARADHELEVTQQIVRDAMAELRASLAALRSPLLERESPGHMLAGYAHEAGARAGWHVVYDVATDLGSLDPAAREALLRVGAEALTNVERHARAHTVTVTLKRESTRASGGAAGEEPDETILLRVADDGVGMGSTPGARDGGAHFGITGMRERVAALGGRFTIAAGGTGGTVVQARIPALAPSAPERVAEAPAVDETAASPVAREAAATSRGRA